MIYTDSKSNEAINFQKGSLFANDLMNLFQKPINIRDASSSREEAIKKVKEFCKNEMYKEFHDIVYKHTGLICDKIRLDELKLNFACSMKIGDKFCINANKYICAYSGQPNQAKAIEDYLKHKKFKSATYEDMVNIVRSLDKEKGIFRNVELKSLKCNATFELYFDSGCAYLSQEIYGANAPRFTTDEITAIILHEIGHMFSMLEHSAEVYFKMNVMKVALLEFNKNAPVTDKIKFTLQTLKNDGDKRAEAAEKKVYEMKTKSPSIFLVAISFFSICFSSLFALLSSFIALFCHFVCPVTTLYNAYDDDDLYGNIRGKRSDFDARHDQEKYCEQLADQFVARHGMSRGQISGLDKLYEIMTSKGILSVIVNDQLCGANSNALWHLSKLPYYIYATFNGEMDPERYDFLYERCERLSRETLKALCDNNLPQSVKEIYLADYDECVKRISKINSYCKYGNATKSFWDTFEYLLALPLSAFSNANYYREYEKLVDNTEKLESNMYFYHQVKLTQLINKQKLQSTEAIAFQSNSKLASELTKLFQSIMDMRNASSTVEDAVEKVEDYCHNNLLKEFNAIVYRNTGITCSEIMFGVMPLNFACLMNVGDQYGLNANRIISAYSGRKGKNSLFTCLTDNEHFKLVSKEDLLKIANSLDKETGIFRETVLNSMHKGVSFKLMFDVTAAFFIEERVDIHEKSLTAEELTAIILHEIGHMFTMLEHSVETYYKMNVMKMALINFGKNAPIQEKEKVVIDMVKAVDPKKGETLEKKGYAAKKRNPHFLMLYNTVVTIVMTSVHGVQAFCGGILNRMMYSALSILNKFSLMDYLLDPVSFVLKEKRSDFDVTHDQEKYCEQLADQFVARHGMSSYLVSGLAKIVEASLNQSIANTYDFTILYYIAKFPLFIQLTFNDGQSEAYDAMLERMERSAKETLKALSNSSKLSPRAKAVYIADYERSMDYIKNKLPSSVKYYTIMNKLWNLIDYIISLPIAAITNGNYYREYEKLIDNIEDLNANKFNYHSAKLEQVLAEKNKSNK